MKKNSLILWIASFVIVFLAGYISQITDKNYPISATFGIDGKKVSYRFEKLHFGKNDLTIIIRSDVQNLSGNLFWKNLNQSNWNSTALNDSNSVLTGKIPAQKPKDKILYFIELLYQNKKYVIPSERKIELTFYGKIPVVIEVLKSLLLYIGMILAIRTSLEYFNKNKGAKKFSVLTVINFLILAVLINPLYLTYKYGYMNRSIPSIANLFPIGEVLMMLLWIITVVLLFTLKNFSYTSILSGLVSLIIFITLL
mgnify:CR=1 FL=1